MKKALTLTAGFGLALSLALAPAALAAGSQTWTAQLGALNDSGASGTATLTLNGNALTVKIEAKGLTPSAPHAQHLHIGGQHTCPTMSADANNDGVLTTVEGQPAYGMVKVSLTTSGDTSADSAVAVARFPSADADGNLSYSRTFNLPSGVTADDIANAVVVQHGVDLDGSGKYDGDAKSQLDPSLPLEATVPADCGKPSAMTMPPTDTLTTDSGPGNSQLPLALVAGGLALVGLAFVFVRRGESTR